MTKLLDDYKAFIDDEESSSLFKTWKTANPKEYAAFAGVEAAIFAGNEVALPNLKSAHGRALVDVARLYLDATATPMPPPPPPPPPPPGTTVAFPHAPVGLVMPTVTAAPISTAYWDRDVQHPKTISNVHVSGSPDYGVAIMGTFGGPTAPPAPSPGPYTIRNVIAERVGHVPPISDGRSEAGLWGGASANISSAWADGSWEGAWFGCMGRHMVIDSLIVAKRDPVTGLPSGPVDGIGVYIEHPAFDLTFRNCFIWSKGNGVNREWWYTDAMYAAAVQAVLGQTGPWAGKAGSWNVTFDNCVIISGAACIFADAGNGWMTVKGGTKLMGNNGIAWPDDAHLIDPSWQVTIDPSVDFSGLTGYHTQRHARAIG